MSYGVTPEQFTAALEIAAEVLDLPVTVVHLLVQEDHGYAKYDVAADK
jgi:hypothetical protein